eukprot:UN4401
MRMCKGQNRCRAQPAHLAGCFLRCQWAWPEKPTRGVLAQKQERREKDPHDAKAVLGALPHQGLVQIAPCLCREAPKEKGKEDKAGLAGGAQLLPAQPPHRQEDKVRAHLLVGARDHVGEAPKLLRASRVEKSIQGSQEPHVQLQVGEGGAQLVVHRLQSQNHWSCGGEAPPLQLRVEELEKCAPPAVVHKDSKKKFHKARVALPQVDGQVHRAPCVSERERLVK